MHGHLNVKFVFFAQRTENKTTVVVIHQHSHKLLMTDILMSQTYWVHKKWNKIASDIKLVFYSLSNAIIHLRLYAGTYEKYVVMEHTVVGSYD